MPSTVNDHNTMIVQLGLRGWRHNAQDTEEAGDINTFAGHLRDWSVFCQVVNCLELGPHPVHPQYGHWYSRCGFSFHRAQAIPV